MKFGRLLTGLVSVGVLAGGGYYGYNYWNSRAQKSPQVRTGTVTQGDLVQSVTANGQIVPLRSVQVGSQISGTILKINVDFNSRVKAGDVIAQIDAATYERGLLQAEAELSNAMAAKALTELNFKRSKELHQNKLISDSDFNRAEVDLQQAESIVKMRQANVERAKVDLDRTTITAPIDGIVISRNVEVGQTVAASFNTPTLFLIANDLAKMQIEASVSEADVGGVEETQPVTFSVDAYPTRKFEGVVKQVRFAPTTNQNVVTYTCVVDVDNSDLKLRPGMTANANIITSQRKGVLRVPNAALRFRPPEGVAVAKPTNAAVTATSPGASSNQVELATSGPFAGLPIPPWTAEGRRRANPGEREQWEATLTPEQRERVRQIFDQMRARFAEGGGGGGRGSSGGGRSGSGGGPGGGFGGLSGGESRPAAADGPRTQTLYLVESGKGPDGKETQTLKSVTARVGISDGSFTEVLEGLKNGDVVATGLVTPEPAAGASAAASRGPMGGSPFGGGRGFR